MIGVIMGKFLTTKRSRRLFITWLITGLVVLGLTGLTNVAFTDPLPWELESSIPLGVRLAQLVIWTLSTLIVGAFVLVAFVLGLYFLFGYLPKKHSAYNSFLYDVEDFFDAIGRGITFPFRALGDKVKSWVNQGE